MKLYRTSDFAGRKNPTPGKVHRLEILSGEDKVPADFVVVE
jgi:hypothetical protein